MDPVAAAALESWSLGAWTAIAILSTGIVYLRGWLQLRRQLPRRFPAWRLACFQGGLAVVLLAIASPLDAFGELLLQVHMLQHLLLMMVAPPLLWLGAPFAPLLRGLPASWLRDGLGPFLAWPALRSAAHWLVHPVVAWLAFVVATWVWHAPALYELALRSSFWHEVEHLCFIGTGLLFWWPVIQPWPSRSVWPRVAMVPYLLLASLQTTAFSALFAFSERPIYSAYELAPRLFGIGVLADQAAAGAVMWVPGSIILLACVSWILVGELQPRLAVPGSVTRGRTPHRARVDATARARTPPRRGRLDLLAVPLLGALLRWPHFRRVAQAALLLLSLAIVLDGWLGPQGMSPMNLAGVLPWTYWRGLVVVALLVAGNLFCFACPFMLPRALARRFLRPSRPWPAWLRSKWLAVGLLVVYLWAYEIFGLWDSPWWTAWIVVGYFVAALAIDGVFRGASFCKYVCPIGQFHFVQSMASPFAVAVRSADRCGSCRSLDCIRGNERHRGCELELFQPRKVGNLDCTFCLDCIHACPHDNVGILAVTPAMDLTCDPARSSIGRLSRRPDLAALALVLCFGAFVNAAGMVAPIVGFEDRLAGSLGFDSPRAVVTALLLLGLVAIPAASAALCGWLAGAASRVDTPWRRLACHFSFSLVPLGFAMWLAHFGFHLATGIATGIPVVQRVAQQIGWSALGTPDWSLSGAGVPASRLLPLEILALDVGLLLSLYVAWRIALSHAPRPVRALQLVAPWAVLAAVLWMLGIWVFFQPMQMRGMVM